MGIKPVPSFSGTRASFQVYFHGVPVCRNIVLVAAVEIWEIKLRKEGKCCLDSTVGIWEIKLRREGKCCLDC